MRLRQMGGIGYEREFLARAEKAEAEIERLRAEKAELVVRSQERNTTYERDVDQLEAEIDRLRAINAELVEALSEIAAICTESPSACRKRMGTRPGNALVTARAAIAKATTPSARSRRARHE